MNQQLYNIALLVLGIWFVGNQTAQTLTNIKLLKTMATFTDLQTSSAALATAATNLETAIATFKATQADNITPAQADTIKTDIDAAVTSLNNAAATLTA